MRLRWRLWHLWLDILLLPWRIARCWSMVKLYWGTEDCDWSVAAMLLRHQIRRIREHVLTHNILYDSDRTARQMLITETLLTRMIAEDYYTIADKRHPARDSHWVRLIRNLERQDEGMLANELRRHFRYWWV